MVGSTKHRGLVELEIYQREVKALGVSFRTLDEALNLFTWVLSENPREFDPVPGLTDCYIGKTERFLTSGGIVIPPLRIFYRIGPSDNTVYLGSIRRIT